MKGIENAGRVESTSEMISAQEKELTAHLQRLEIGDGLEGDEAVAAALRLLAHAK